MKKVSLPHFQKIILANYDAHGRRLPWRISPTPYHVVISEVMLQQTQVDRVVPKYKAFIKQFPSFRALHAAPLARVLKAWSGLGYNRRALLLKKLAEEVVKKYKGKLPNDLEKLDDLPGIGPGSAAAIVTYAYNGVAPFIETNVRAVYIHFFFPKKKKVRDAALWPIVVKTVDRRDSRRWFNALMDYGVLLKKEFKNPARRSAHHAKQSRFAGSNRQVRGAILKLLAATNNLPVRYLLQAIPREEKIILKNIAELEKEGFLKQTRGRIAFKN